MQTLETVELCDVFPYEREDGEAMNPRDFSTKESAAHIADLAEQFKHNRLNPGQPVMKPILYRDGGIYRIIDGECRVRAMRSIGTKRFLAEVYDDLDDAELARAEAAKAMVETDVKLGLTAAEKSRGVQTMLALDIPDEEVAAAARTDAATVHKARRAVRKVQDAAYDMTLDRLAAIAEFEGDDEAVAKLRDCKQSDWQRVYAGLRAAAANRRNRAEMVAIIADAGVEFADECPEGYEALRTFSDFRPDLAVLDAYVADNADKGLLAEETEFGVTLLAPMEEVADESAQAAAQRRADAQRKADFYAAYEDGRAARLEWISAHALVLRTMHRTALALTALAMEDQAVEAFEEMLGRPIDRTPTELAVAMGWRAAWNMNGGTAWALVSDGGSVYVCRDAIENVTIVYEAMKADGYEPNAAETETYEACVARLESEQ